MKSLCILAGLALGASASAAPLFYEPFLTGSDASAGEYSLALLPGQGPTIAGATGTWGISNADQSTSVNGRVTGTGLSYAGLPSAGGAAESFRNGSATFTGTFYFKRPAAQPQTLDVSETLYFSGLVSFASGKKVGIGVQFENRDGFGVGFDSDGKAGIFVGDSFSGKTAGTYLPDTTYFIVGKMTPTGGAGNTGAGELIELLAINPVDLATEPAGNVTSSSQNVWGENVGTDDITNFLFIATKSTSNVAATADEIRVGKSWADVTATVPEPATMGLLGLAGLVGLRRRRAQ